MAEKHIMFEILYELNAFDLIRDTETSDIMLNVLSMFCICPRKYDNGYKWL